MEGGETVKVSVVIDPKPNIIPCSNTFTAEELCILLCKQYKIPPLTRTLFALRVRGRNYFLKDNTRVLSSTRDYELRIRFKVPRIGLLITLDETTYDYYFQQARNDVYENKIPEVKYPEHKPDLLGLGITDMTRAVVEKNMTLKEVVKNYKKFIPKVIVTKHGPYPKKYAHDYLPNLVSIGNSANHVKKLYLQHLYGLAPNYLAEEFNDVLWRNGNDTVPVRIVVTPFHPHEPGIRLYNTVTRKLYLQHLYGLAPNYLAEEFNDVLWRNGNDTVPVRIVVTPFHPHEPGIRLYNTVTRKWFHMCSIEELIYLTRNGDLWLEVSRRGTPLFFKFKTEEQLSSFISVCDGYYRLMVKWIFNLSKDDETPSLKELQRIKCHGPVGGAFSYRKLEEKRAKKHGSYILRQCQDDYNLYYLDVCTKNSTTETYRIEYHGHCYTFNEQEFHGIEKIIEYHQNPDGRIFLNECIPPSEYDKSQLLLCGEPQKKGVRIDQAELQEILKDNKSPRCLPSKDILIYTGSEKLGSEGLTATFKALWRLDETKKLVVAFKTLQKEKTNDYLKDFIELASKWACVQSTSIVRLYGITLSSPTAMVLEYLPYGPFDDYLREHGSSVSVLMLKKVSATLARALWDLSEAGVVHGCVRCSRLLVAARDSRLQVKLAGPSLRRYTPHDVHWIPVELHSDMSLARRSVAADIWAFATTLWEVFSYGQSPTDTNPILTARSYEVGERLMRPARCPSEVWALLRPCWQPDPPRPQAIMRDINHMLHAEYVPVHQYEEPKISLDNNMDHADTVSSDRFIPSESDAGSNKSLISEDSSVQSMNGTLSEQYNNSFGDSRSFNSLGSLGLPYGLRGGVSARSLSSAGGAADDELPGSQPRLMESIVSQGKTYLVTLNRRIGSGNYGHVFKGVMECDNQESDRKEVAVKKLTRNAAERNSTLYEDFKNELEIMKSLVHVNIVEILGYSWAGGDVLIVMEYLEEGSLNYYLKFQGDKLRTAHLLKYCLDIASGMDHVSSKGIVHRDLATRNILVVNKYHVKISDFGLARILPREEDNYRLKTLRLLPVNWYAPESAVKPYSFSTKSDVWSYGVTAWEIFTRATVEVPKFDDERPLERASCFPNPKDCPWELYEHLMKICWKLDPKQRPTFINLVHTCKRFMEEYK